ncbi:MAG TPA: sulfotransferase family 2 domain-containing protein [Caulobacteraceae bacterium]|nr:sulfotransferase family 2 domain-containing protein [Caulobacteraceae bacterium]
MSASYAIGRIRSQYPDIAKAEIESRLRYSTFVDATSKFLYFEIPKNACSTIKLYLREMKQAPALAPFTDWAPETNRNHFVHSRVNVPLPSLLDLSAAQQEEAIDSDDFVRLLVVRNPYERLVSAWKSKVFLREPGFGYVYRAVRGRDEPSGYEDLVSLAEFVDFVERCEDLSSCNSHWRLQSEHIFHRSIKYNSVFSTDTLGQALEAIAAVFAVAPPRQPRKANTSVEAVRAALTPETAEKIRRLYSPDFAAFNFSTAPPAALFRPPQEADPVARRLIEEVVERNILLDSLYGRWREASMGWRRRSRRRLARVKSALFPSRRESKRTVATDAAGASIPLSRSS